MGSPVCECASETKTFKGPIIKINSSYICHISFFPTKQLPS